MNGTTNSASRFLNHRKIWSLFIFASAILFGALSTRTAAAVDYVTIRQGQASREVAGRIEVEAEDGGVLLLGLDGTLWPVAKDDLASRRTDNKPFAALSKEELTRNLIAELPGFRVHATQHYLICYNTSPAYARWVGGLFEGLHKAFYNYWTRRGAVLHEPEFPLIALAFDSRSSFTRHAQREIGERANKVIGYYNVQTNRMTMYDLTGVEAAGLNERTAAARINQILSQPDAERQVATIVHEATHQLAFNSGLQTRFADCPFGISEGLAIFFETPNLESTKGWRSVGSVNRYNLINFRKYLPRRPPGNLETLLTDDKRFSDETTSADAYAEAWALTYFLLQTRSESYVKYLAKLVEQKPLVDTDPQARIKQFKQFFGDDLVALENEFLRYMRTVN